MSYFLIAALCMSAVVAIVTGNYLEFAVFICTAIGLDVFVREIRRLPDSSTPAAAASITTAIEFVKAAQIVVDELLDNPNTINSTRAKLDDAADMLQEARDRLRETENELHPLNLNSEASPS